MDIQSNKCCDKTIHPDLTRKPQFVSFFTPVHLKANFAVSNPWLNLQITLDSYMQDTLDPAEEIKIQKEIKQWKKMERNLELEIQKVKTTLKQNIDRSVKKVGGVK